MGVQTPGWQAGRRTYATHSCHLSRSLTAPSLSPLQLPYGKVPTCSAATSADVSWYCSKKCPTSCDRVSLVCSHMDDGRLGGGWGTVGRHR